MIMRELKLIVTLALSNNILRSYSYATLFKYSTQHIKIPIKVNFVRSICVLSLSSRFNYSLQITSIGSMRMRFC